MSGDCTFMVMYIDEGPYVLLQLLHGNVVFLFKKCPHFSTTLQCLWPHVILKDSDVVMFNRITRKQNIMTLLPMAVPLH